MENKNTNFDIFELLEKEKNTNGEMNSVEDVVIEDIIDTNLESIDILTNITINDDSVQNITLDIENNNFQNEEVNILTEKTNISKKIFGSFLFVFKYLATSSLIFIFLLSVTNYNAYIEIARSYLNPEILEQNKLALLASVNGANINSENKSEENKVEKKETIGEKISMVKNKTYHSMDKLLSGDYDESLNIKVDVVPYENRIIIPKIGKNIPLIEVKNKTVKNVKELEDIFMKELSDGIVRYPGSAKPGEIGNSFIFGHSSNFPWIKGEYNDVFALLDNVVFGDEIIAYYNQKKYIFKVKEKKIITPGDTSVLKKDVTKAEISLMTCWPVGTTLHRMIVVGELVE